MFADFVSSHNHITINWEFLYHPVGLFLEHCRVDSTFIVAALFIVFLEVGIVVRTLSTLYKEV
jgi:hypothetical protein